MTGAVLNLMFDVDATEMAANCVAAKLEVWARTEGHKFMKKQIYIYTHPHTYKISAQQYRGGILLKIWKNKTKQKQKP